MSISGRFLLFFLTLFAEELYGTDCSRPDGKLESEVELELKEPLRHQQNHWPSFIDRKLIDSATMKKRPSLTVTDLSLPEREVSTDKHLVHDKSDLVADRSRSNQPINDQPKKEEVPAAAQIRHGRSRSHFQRQVKVEDSDPRLGPIKSTKSKKVRVANSTERKDEEPFAERQFVKDLENRLAEDVRRTDRKIERRKTSVLVARNSDTRRGGVDDTWSKKDSVGNLQLSRRTDDRLDEPIDRPIDDELAKEILPSITSNGTFQNETRTGKENGSGNVIDRQRFRGSNTPLIDAKGDQSERVEEMVKEEGYEEAVEKVDEDEVGREEEEELEEEEEEEEEELENMTTVISPPGKVAMSDERNEDESSLDAHVLEDYDIYEGEKEGNVSTKSSFGEGFEEGFEEGYEDRGKDESAKRSEKEPVQIDIVTRFLRIIENQHLLGENCTAGTDLNLGEGVVDQYAQERFRLEANLAVNHANMLTRLWKYAPEVMLSSEYLLHANVLAMVEFDEDIFAGGNCYDKLQYKDRWLYCPFAHRLQDQDGVLVKDLSIEYKYLSNSSEWFYIARKNAERVIASNNQFSHGFHTYTHNESTHTEREEDEILTVRYEDGRWSKPYYDCGGGNIWMLTYTVPFFGYVNDTYFFKGTSGIDIDLRRVDIDQCPLPPGSSQLNIFAASDKCKKRTTECVAIPGLGFRRGSYRCVCKRGFYYPDTKSTKRYYNGTVIEEEYEKLMMGEESQYAVEGVFECLPCAEGCEFCEDGSPCVVSLNWLMRTAILILECCVIACLPVVVLFTWKYGNVKVVRAASPVLLRVIVLGAFFIYCTTIVMYPRPNIVTCTVRVWLREIGFSLTYGALMLKTWRISVIFRVKSAKAVKITDASLLKRLGIIVMIFSVFLSIRTLVAPPVVIVARTADDLKAYLCRTDWWDHSFTTLEVMFLIWGIRLCIVVRKTPSEFNESRFISMAIYNEFLLSVFLNVSMLFLQSPANPDLLYIIFFCHTQLTVTLLLCLIFGSKAYVVFRGEGKEDNTAGKFVGTTGKFLGKSGRAQGTSNQTNSISLQQGNFTDESDGATEEFRRVCAQLEVLKDKHVLLGNYHLVNKITAMQEAANRTDTQVATIQAISSSMRVNDELSGASAIEETELGGRSTQPEEEARKERPVSIEGNITRSNEFNDSRRKMRQSDHVETTDVKTTDVKTTDVKTTDAAVATSSRPVTEDIGTDTNIGLNGKEGTSKNRCKTKSGHARTHAIVINLDDKSRFSEEVTV